MKGFSSTKDLIPEQAPEPQGIVPVAFWAAGPSVWVARQGPPASLRAQGKAPTIQGVLAPLAEINIKLV